MCLTMHDFHPLQIGVEREPGFLAAVPELPGVMACGATAQPLTRDLCPRLSRCDE